VAVTDSSGFPDARARVDPLLAVADLDRALAFWIEGLGADAEVRWDSYALLRIGEGRLHLAVSGEPPGRSAGAPYHRHAGVDGRGGDPGSGLPSSRRRASAARRHLPGPTCDASLGDEVRAFLLDPDGHLVEISSPG